MTELQPGTVCNIVDLLLGVLDITGGLGDFVTEQALNLLGCDGEQVLELLQALDALAKSGALDFYIPLASVFDDQGQLRALIDIFHLLVEDLTYDDDADPETHSALRPLLPVIGDVIRSGAVDTLFDLLDVMSEVELINGEGTMAEEMVDAIAHMVDSDQTVQTRNGAIENTSHILVLLDQLLELIERVEDGPGRESIDRIMGWIFDLITETSIDDRGTSDPSDDRPLPDQHET